MDICIHTNVYITTNLTILIHEFQQVVSSHCIATRCYYYSNYVISWQYYVITPTYPHKSIRTYSNCFVFVWYTFLALHMSNFIHTCIDVWLYPAMGHVLQYILWHTNTHTHAQHINISNIYAKSLLCVYMTLFNHIYTYTYNHLHTQYKYTFSHEQRRALTVGHIGGAIFLVQYCIKHLCSCLCIHTTEWICPILYKSPVLCRCTCLCMYMYKYHRMDCQTGHSMYTGVHMCKVDVHVYVCICIHTTEWTVKQDTASIQVCTCAFIYTHTYSVPVGKAEFVVCFVLPPMHVWIHIYICTCAHIHMYRPFHCHNLCSQLSIVMLF